MTAPVTPPPDAIMLLGTHCPHCPGVLKNLTELIKSGELGRLQVINLEQHPDDAAQFGVRSVPWVKIGDYELSGAQDMAALRQRIEWTNNASSLAGEFDHLLSNGKANQVIEHIRNDNKSMSVILDLLKDPATILSTRIGIGVIMEEFAGTDLLREYIPQLAKLADHEDARIRADALHYLGLTQSPEAIPVLEKHLDDGDAEVREVAADSLQALREIEKQGDTA